MDCKQGIQIDSCPCPPYHTLPLQLGCVVQLNPEVGAKKCVCAKLNLKHKGGKTWEGTISGASYSWTITMQEINGSIEIHRDTTDSRCWGTEVFAHKMPTIVENLNTLSSIESCGL